MSTTQYSTRRSNRTLGGLVGAVLALALLGWFSTAGGIPVASAGSVSSGKSLQGNATFVRSAPNQSCNSKPAAPLLGGPEDGVLIIKPLVTLKWIDVVCEVHYQVQIINVGTNVPAYKEKLDANVLQFTASRLTRGRTYNWF